MKKTIASLSTPTAWAGFFFLMYGSFVNPSYCQAFDASINISPNIINLDSIDHTFGIHTNVPYSIVNLEAAIELECPDGSILEPIVCYADSRGYLIAKFETADLNNEADTNNECFLETGEYNIFALTGQITEPEEEFYGEGEVLVIEDQAKFRKGTGSNAAQNKWGQNR